MIKETNTLDSILEYKEMANKKYLERTGKMIYLFDNKYLSDEPISTAYTPKDFRAWWGDFSITYIHIPGILGFYNPKEDIPVVVYGSNPREMYFAAAHEQDHKWRQNTGQPQNEAGPDRFARNMTGIGIYRDYAGD